MKHKQAKVTASRNPAERPAGRKRAVLYVRVSTDEQAEKGYSLDTQLEACRKYAADHDFVEVAYFTDDYTGTRLDRPGLDQVRKVLDQRIAEVVIVFSSDRLTRNLAHLLILREEWQRAGIELHYVKRGKSEDTPESRMMDNIEGVFNECWREKIVEASRRGSNGKAKKGEVIGSGSPPYGYCFARSDDPPAALKAKNNALEIVETEAQIVRWIYEWYVYGDGDTEPLNSRAIAKKLSEMRIPSPGERRKDSRRVREPGMWRVGTILRMLENETYAGVWWWGKEIGRHGKGGKRPVEERIAVPVPPIVSRGLWQVAQERREQNKRNAKRSAKRAYLLRGMVKCGGCGGAMIGEKQSRCRWHGYRCCWHVNHFSELEGHTRCKQGAASGPVLESVVWRYVLDLITDPERFEAELRKAQAAERSAVQPKWERLEIVGTLIAQAKAEADSLARSLSKIPAGGIVAKSLQDKIAEVDRRYAALVKEQEELQAAVDANTLTDDQIETLAEYRRKTLIGLEHATFEDKRAMLEVLRTEVTVTGKTAVVKCRLPVAEDVFDLQTASGQATRRRINSPQ